MRAIGVGFFVGAGIPKGPRVNTFVECGCCSAYHRTDFHGDCREDSERYYDLPDDAEVVYFDDDDDGEFCESNQCESPACHRCYPRADCERHSKCLEFQKSREAYSECEECGHPLKEGDETHYPECSRINVS